MLLELCSGRSDKEFMIPFSLQFLKAPPLLSMEDMPIFADAFIKHPDVLPLVMDGSLDPSKDVPVQYREIFVLIQRQVMDDPFIKKLDERIAYYLTQYESEKNSESKALYKEMRNIFERERDTYAISNRSDKAQKSCGEAIVKNIEKLEATSFINEENELKVKLMEIEWIMSLMKFFGLIKSDEDKKVKLSENMHTFMHQSKTAIVRDIVDVCDSTNAFLGFGSNNSIAR